MSIYYMQDFILIFAVQFLITYYLFNFLNRSGLDLQNCSLYDDINLLKPGLDLLYGPGPTFDLNGSYIN